MKARLKCTRIQTTQSMILERQSMNDPLQRFFIIISMQLSLRKVFGKLENFSFSVYVAADDSQLYISVRRRFIQL